MRRRKNRWLSLLTLVCIIAAYCITAEAALLDVGTTVVPSPPGHGYPAWYRDNNRVPLEPCLSRTVLPSGPACLLLADPGFNPALPVVFPTNFPEEMFYFAADTTLNMGPGGTNQVIYVAALEGAFGGGPVAPGDQVVFARIRIRADVPVAGTYRFIHPYGVETLVADAPGIRAINLTRDIGLGTFTGALGGNIGPWLVTTGFPITIGTETFIGDPNVPGTVTGSPFGTNFLRVEGPAGSNLDGLGRNFIQTNLFTVAGKVDNAAIATPLTVDSAKYSRDASGTQVSVFATTQPISNARTGLPPNPFALLNIPSALQLTDATATVPVTQMTTNSPPPGDGKFFANAALAGTATLPPTVRVTNTADVPPTSVDVPLVDEVVISEASYAPASNALRVAASSGDLVGARTLQAFIPGEPLPLGTLTGGQLSVTFPKVLGTRTYNVPPSAITVKSSGGGSSTAAVTLVRNRAPIANNDTATVVSGGTVTINVAANDTDPDVGDAVVPATVAIVAQPLNGTAVKNPSGTITYTSTNPAFVGADSFTYTIQDTKGALSNIATVSVAVVPATVPTANNDTATTITGATITISVLANDTSPTSTLNPASVVVTPPTGGTAAANLLNGTVSYTAPATPGTYTFTYTVKDSAATPATSNAATVTVTVTSPAVPPTASNDNPPPILAGSGAVVINVIANDIAGTSPINPASVVIGTPPANGTAVPITTGANAGSVTYTPTAGFTGQNTFTYTVRNSLGVASNAATVTVTVNAPAEVISINRAEFQVGGAAWRVEGATTQRTAGETVKIFNSATVPADGTTGLIGTVNADARGAWALQLKPGPQPNALRRFSVLTSLGGKLENITLVVR